MTSLRVPKADRMFLEDPIQTGWRTCVICAQQGYEPTPTLSLLAPTEERGEKYEVLVRCKDHGACRSRCEAAGDRWPLAR